MNSEYQITNDIVIVSSSYQKNPKFISLYVLGHEIICFNKAFIFLSLLKSFRLNILDISASYYVDDSIVVKCTRHENRLYLSISSIESERVIYLNKFETLYVHDLLSMKIRSLQLN